MALTLKDILEKLKQEDEVSVVELLDLRSDDLVERFIDIVEDKLEKLREEYEDEDDEWD